jgi:hypothetical protein
MLDTGDLTVTDHHVCPPIHYEFDEQTDIAGIVLVVSIGIDDDVRAVPERKINPCLESGGQTAVAAMANNMVCSTRACDGGGAVLAAVINDKNFNHINSGNAARYRCKRGRERILLVEARDLDDEFDAHS